MNIGIKNNQKKQRLQTSLLAKKLGNLLLGIGRPDTELSVLFAGDRAMRTLNRRYRGKDRTTDVLSFALQEGEHPPVHVDILGDIVISVPAAVRQARAAGHSVGREIEILLIHGLLHLLGYDHERSAADARKMRRREVELLKRYFS